MRYSAGDNRQHARRRVRPAHRVHYVILEVQPQFQYSPLALNELFVSSPSGQKAPLRTLVNTVATVAPLIVNHQDQFPLVTLSFNLKSGISIGDAVDAIHKMEGQLGKPASMARSFQSNAKAFLASLSSEPILIAGALVVIYIILGVLL